MPPPSSSACQLQASTQSYSVYTSNDKHPGINRLSCSCLLYVLNTYQVHGLKMVPKGGNISNKLCMLWSWSGKEINYCAQLEEEGWTHKFLHSWQILMSFGFKLFLTNPLKTGPKKAAQSFEHSKEWASRLSTSCTCTLASWPSGMHSSSLVIARCAVAQPSGKS